MLLAALIVLNIPVYLFIGWLVFDTRHNAADTFFDTIVAIVKAICVPRIVRVLAGDDEDDGTLPGVRASKLRRYPDLPAVRKAAGGE